MVGLIAGNKAFDCKLVVFDKDGTLVDLYQVLLALAGARRLTVEEHGGSEVAGLWEKVMGVDLAHGKMDYGGPLATAPRQQEILIASAAFYLKGCPWEEARKHAEKAYDEADERMRPPFGTVLLKGVEAALTQMEAHGLKLAIASTDTHRRIATSFEALGIAPLFDAFVGDDDVVNGKPAPDMIVEAMKHTGCTAEQTIMVGDSVFDMRMGKNAKVNASVGVLTGSTKREKLEQFADIVIPSVAEIRLV
jgi:HAD superfamily hydrolase (TIGR01509 family)